MQNSAPTGLFTPPMVPPTQRWRRRPRKTHRKTHDVNTTVGNALMASSSTSATSSELELPLQLNTSSESGTKQYPYPSHVNTSNFLSIKLNETNYGLWQEQMLCLIKGHGMLGFIDGTFKNPKENEDSKGKASESIMEANYGEWERSDSLVKGWIFGSVCESVMGTLVGLQTTNDVWTKLRTAYGTPPPTDTPIYYRTPGTEEVSMCRAIQKGDWDNVQQLFFSDRNLLTAKLNSYGQTALHVAVETGENLKFLENLLKELKPDHLPDMVDDIGANPAHTAALVGNTAAAMMLVKKNPRVLFVVDERGKLPIHKAASVALKPTFVYFLEVCKKYIEFSQQEGYHSPFEGSNGALFLYHVINEGFIDAAYDFLKERPYMATTTFRDFPYPLAILAGKKDLFYSGTEYNWYQRFVYSFLPIDKNIGDTDHKVHDMENQGTFNYVTKRWRSCFHSVLISGIYAKIWKMTLLHVLHIKHLKEDKEKHNTALMLLKFICDEVFNQSKIVDITSHITQAMELAAKNNTPEAIEEIVKCDPDAAWFGVDGSSIIQIGIINRNEKVYNAMVYHPSINKTLLKASRNKDINNLLHSAGHLAPIHKLNVVSGAALQMQRELQWFQEVEKFMYPESKEEKNIKEETPMMVFRREHKELRKEGEEWMKKTADSYTISAALIITIVFAAAITVPGGNNSDTGQAIYSRKPSFIIFAFSDAISLFTSTTTLLLFQSILTARYRDEDFLYRLPKRLILGLVMLFLSVTSLMVAFSAILYMMFGQGRAWILYPVVALPCLPIFSFVRLQFPLLFELISSTYGHGIFDKQNDYKKKKKGL